MPKGSKWNTTIEDHGGNIESMAKKTPALKNGEKLCKMVQNYKHLYDMMMMIPVPGTVTNKKIY